MATGQKLTYYTVEIDGITHYYINRKDATVAYNAAERASKPAKHQTTQQQTIEWIQEQANSNGKYHTLLDITGQESGLILYNNGDLIICNWSGERGLPRLTPWGVGVLGLDDTLTLDDVPRRINNIGRWIKQRKHQCIYDVTNDYLTLSGQPGTLYKVNGVYVIAPDDWA